MLLAEVLRDIPVTKLYSAHYGKMAPTQEIAVSAIRYDSRKVERGDLFVAIPGTTVNGQSFIDDAIQRGAAVVVLQDDNARPDALFMHTSVVKIVVGDARKTLALLAKNFYGDPSRSLLLIGVTGTNGKTTTTHLIKAVLEESGRKTGLIGTIEYRAGDRVIPATHTTPESVDLNALLRSMIDQGCTAAVMEVSSHALALSRVHGLKFAAAVFTNLTQDHLDYHKSMDAYFEAKKTLFKNLDADAHAVTNVDDERGLAMIDGTAAQITTYSVAGSATVTANDIHQDVHGSKLTVWSNGETQQVTSSLTGKFNLSNLLAAFAACAAIGIPGATIARALGSVRGVRGRFEQIVSPKGWTAVIDYAHTPDALEKCLTTIRDILPPTGNGRIITVFGCGGNRDKAKRPIMGRIATTLGHVTIITSDNPRKEDPDAIIEEVRNGCVPDAEVHVDADRRKAVAMALSMARQGDVVLIAGKGHETYQVIGETNVHFDDREEVERFLRGSR